MRVIAATRRDLGQFMNSGRFRSDLFFRIAQVRVETPALRERREDIPLLVRAACARIGKPERAPEVTQLVTQFKQMRQMMKEMGKAPRRKKSKKAGKGGRSAKKGGRVTAKGPAPLNKAKFQLPTMEEMESQLPKGGGFPKLT